MLELATKPVPKLSIISTLFEVLHKNSIHYCHWKSNEHLAESLQGLTDLDVLFAADQKDRVESILHGLGFKKFHAIRQKLYKDIVDFLIIDPESGKVIHLHTHYRLTMGEPYLKGYQFTSDIESRILKDRSFNETYGLYCIHPAFELVLLFVRESLKLRHRDIVLAPAKKKSRDNQYILREFNWLKSKTSNEEIEEVIRSSFNNDRTMYHIVTGELNLKQLRRLSAIIKKKYFVTPLYSPLTGILQRWYREATVVISRKLATLLNKPILFKRINPRRGIVVAIVGADGSGKSTITENLKRSFEGKLDVFKIYFGRGDGKASGGRKLLSTGKSLYHRQIKHKPESNEPAIPIKRKGLLRKLYKALEAMLVAREKKQNLKLIQTAKKKGAFVICDRYPQNQTMGYNDGPLLAGEMSSSNPLLRMLAKSEAKVYAQAQNNPPDLVFKLVADPQVMEKRKPGETAPEKLRMKIQGIKELAFNPSVKVITVDVSKPLDEVLYLIRTEIWKIL